MKLEVFPTFAMAKLTTESIKGLNLMAAKRTIDQVSKLLFYPWAVCEH
jgi:hypothetical protein